MLSLQLYTPRRPSFLSILLLLLAPPRLAAFHPPPLPPSSLPPLPPRPLLATPLPRRLFLAAAASLPLAPVGATQLTVLRPSDAAFPWRPLDSLDVGGGALRRVEQQYSEGFAAYLSRLLLNWEPSTRRWWAARQAEAVAFTMDEEVEGVMRILGTQRRDRYLAESFSSLVTSTQLGLQQFGGQPGALSLALALRRLCSTPPQKLALAQLLSMIPPPLQPSALIDALVGEADDAAVSGCRLEARGEGYASPLVAPNVSAPPTAAGRPARVRVEMARTSRWIDATVTNGGRGYAEGESPEVSIPPPPQPNGTRARAVAVVANGSVVALRLVERGAGYTAPLPVFIAPPARGALIAGRKAAARGTLVPEWEVASVTVVDGGSGYNADEPPSVTILPQAEGAAAAQVALQLSPRKGELSRSELVELQRRLEAAARAAPQVTYVGPATPPPISYGLPLPFTADGQAQLLPPGVVPKRQPAGHFALPLNIPKGAFGRRAPAPIERLTPLSALDVGKIFLAGGLCSSTAHTALVPLDVVKTRLQTEPDRFRGPLDCVVQVSRDEGIEAFVQGAGATWAGYAVAGSLSFGLLEVFSRIIFTFAGEGNSLFFNSPLIALSSVFATAVCATAVCPFEAVRIMSVRSGASSVESFRKQVASDGFASLFRGLPAILLKEIPFVVTKFVVFDQVASLLGGALPDGADGFTADVLLPLACGAIAGAFSAAASQPADAVLTLTNQDGATLASAAAEVVRQPQLVLKGLGARVLFGVLLVSLQFLFYSQLRAFFDVSKADLTLVWDTLAFLRN